MPIQATIALIGLLELLIGVYMYGSFEVFQITFTAMSTKATIEDGYGHYNGEDASPADNN